MFYVEPWNASVRITLSAKLWPQMRERQLDRVWCMSTFHRTNGMSVKHRYTDAFSPERPEMLSGDAALLFQLYSGCTGNILSFCPSASPLSISDPLTINDFFSAPQVSFLKLFLLSSFISSHRISTVSHATFLCCFLSPRFPFLMLLSNIGDY